MKRFTLGLAAIAMLAFATSSANAQELLSNPGLDDDAPGTNQAPVGYTYYGGKWYGGTTNAHSGSGAFWASGQCSFCGSPAGWGGGLIQDITAAVLATSPTPGATLNFYQQGFYARDGGFNVGDMVLEIRKFGSTGTPLTVVSTAYNFPVGSPSISTDYKLMQKAQSDVYVPGTTYFAAFGAVVNSGTAKNLHTDSYSVSLAGFQPPPGAPVPEPAAFAMLGLGMVGLGLLVWRKRRNA